MKRLTRRTAQAHLTDFERWPEIQISHLEVNVQTAVLNRKSALKKYMRGEPVREIEMHHSIRREELIRAFNRCLAFDQEGVQICWRGLLPRLRWKPSVRTKPLMPSGRGGRGGLSGALTLLFTEKPQIKEAFSRFLWNTGKARVGYENKIRHKTAHAEFLLLCKKAGVDEKAWPFNTQKLGRGAISSYVNAFIKRNYASLVAGQFGAKAATKAKSGVGEYSKLNPLMPFDIVELDEHRCHFIGAISIDTPGGLRWIVCPRLTILVVADRKFGLILAIKIIFRREACGEDMLDVLHQASVGGPDRGLASTGAQTDDGAFPRDVSDAFHWCGFNQLLVDNALIHIFCDVVERARTLLGFDMNYGPVARPERRPNIEGIFSDMEEHGIQRLRETTGSSTQDPLRRLDDIPINQRLDQVEAVALIHAIVARHNRRKSKGTFGIRRIEQLRLMVDDPKIGMVVPCLPPLPRPR